MALLDVGREALNQQDQIDARFARAFSPIDQLGQIPVHIAQLHLQQAKENQDRLSKMFETIQEQKFRAGEAVKAGERSLALNKQGHDLISEEAKRLETQKESERAKVAKINGANYKALKAQEQALQEKYQKLATTSPEEQNRNAVAAISQIPDGGFLGIGSKANMKAKMIAEIKAGAPFRQVLDRYAKDLDPKTAQVILDTTDQRNQETIKTRLPQLIEVQKNLTEIGQEAQALQRHLIDTGTYDVSATGLPGGTGAVKVSDGASGYFDENGDWVDESQPPDLLATTAAQKAKSDAAKATAAAALAGVPEQTDANQYGQVPLGPAIIAGAKALPLEAWKTFQAVTKPAGDIVPLVANYLGGNRFAAPPASATPDELSRQQAFSGAILRALGGIGNSGMIQSPVSAPAPPAQYNPGFFNPFAAAQGAQPAQEAAPALRSVPVVGPFGPPPNDSELAGLRQTIQAKGIPDANFELFIQKARNDPTGNEMKAISMLRQQVQANASGQPTATVPVSPMTLSPLPGIPQIQFSAPSY